MHGRRAIRSVPTPAPDLPRLAYRVAEVSRMTGIPRASTYRLIKSGALPSVRVVGILLIPADALHELLRSQRKSA